MNGDTKAFELLLDRGYGKALDRLELVNNKQFKLEWDDTREENEQHSDSDGGSEITP